MNEINNDNLEINYYNVTKRINWPQTFVLLISHHSLQCVRVQSNAENNLVHVQTNVLQTTSSLPNKSIKLSITGAHTSLTTYILL